MKTTIALGVAAMLTLSAVSVPAAAIPAFASGSIRDQTAPFGSNGTGDGFFSFLQISLNYPASPIEDRAISEFSLASITAPLLTAELVYTVTATAGGAAPLTFQLYGYTGDGVVSFATANTDFNAGVQLASFAVTTQAVGDKIHVNVLPFLLSQIGGASAFAGFNLRADPMIDVQRYVHLGNLNFAGSLPGLEITTDVPESATASIPFVLCLAAGGWYRIRRASRRSSPQGGSPQEGSPGLLDGQKPEVVSKLIGWIVATTVGLVAVSVQAQSFEYGRVYASSSGSGLDGYTSNGDPIWGDAGQQVVANPNGSATLGGLSRAAYAYANPLGGGYAVSLDVPAGTLRASAAGSPEFVFDQVANGNYYNVARSSQALAWVGFADRITIQGPPLAAYQTIPITLRAHLDGTLAPGNGIRTTSDNLAYVQFNINLVGSDGTSGIAAYDPNMGGGLAFQQSVTTGASPVSLNRDFPVTGAFGPTTAGSPITLWLTAELKTWAGNGGSSEFMNTASFDLVLPEGYTYTSTMAFDTAVPEPAGTALIAGCSLLGIGVWRWARRGNASKC
jgi:hypothetical protein